MTDITTQSTSRFLEPGEGEQFHIRGSRVEIKAAAPRTTVADYTAPAGFPGPPLHVHPGFDEVFLVTEGTLTMRLGDEVRELGPGACAYVDGADPHTFANEAGAPVRFLVVCAPGGFEDYFRALVAGDDAAIAHVSERVGYRPV